MSRGKEPAIPNELLDQLLAGGAASAAFDQGGLLDALKKALTERATRPAPAPATNDQSALKAEVAAVIGELDRLITEAKNG